MATVVDDVTAIKGLFARVGRCRRFTDATAVFDQLGAAQISEEIRAAAAHY